MNKSALTIAIGLSLGASSPPGGEVLATDGHLQPPRLEVAYAFECPAIRATVRYREDRIEPDTGVPLDETLRVTLLDLTVSGASLPPDQLAAVGEVFRSFAWVSSLRATCYRGRVSIGAYGMPLRPFIAYLRDPDGPVPALVTRSFGLTASGLEPFTP